MSLCFPSISSSKVAAQGKEMFRVLLKHVSKSKWLFHSFFESCRKIMHIISHWTHALIKCIFHTLIGLLGRSSRLTYATLNFHLHHGLFFLFDQRKPSLNYDIHVYQFIHSYKNKFIYFMASTCIDMILLCILYNQLWKSMFTQRVARIFLLLPNVFTASGKILRPASNLFWKALVSLQVTFTRLSVLDETLRKIQSSPSQGTVKLKEEKRPVLYHSKPYNYLLQDDRKEIAKALLTLTVMEKRRAKKS